MIATLPRKGKRKVSNFPNFPNLLREFEICESLTSNFPNFPNFPKELENLESTHSSPTNWKQIDPVGLLNDLGIMDGEENL